VGQVKETSKMKERDLVRKCTIRIYAVARGRLKRDDISEFEFNQIKRNLTEVETCMFGGESG